MRVQHWSAILMGLLFMLMAGRQGFAQYGADPQAAGGGVWPASMVAPPGGPSDLGVGTPAVPVPYGLYRYGHHSHGYQPFGPLGPPPDPALAADPQSIPGHHMVSVHPPGQAAYPPQFLPYPEISPFDEHQFNQHYNKGGMWLRDAHDRGKTYYFGLEAMHTTLRQPKDVLLGDPRVPWWIIHEDLIEQDEALEFRVSEPMTMRQVFPHWEWGGAWGMRGQWGFLNPDLSGLEAAAFYSGRTDLDRFFGNPLATPDDLTTLSLQNPGLPLFADPMIVLDPLTDALVGANPLYDMNVRIRYQAEAFGTNVTWRNTPFVNAGNFQVWHVFGARYLSIHERFSFHGRGSGLLYDTEEIEIIEDQPILVPDPTSDVEVLADPFEGFLLASTINHLFGPETGLKYSLGGDKFRVRGETKFGLMFNLEEYRVAGFGLGNAFRPDYDQFDHFDRRRKHATLAPLFEQSIFADIGIFPLIPGLKRMRLFENANLQLGYSFLTVGPVARPMESIVFLHPPANPMIKPERNYWWMSNYHLGLVWQW